MDELLEFSHNLASDHLSIAVHHFFASRQLQATQPHPWSWIQARRDALSSILHAYSGCDAAVNLIGYSLFFDESSPRFVPPDQRDLPLKRMIQAWHVNLPSHDKLNYVLGLSKNHLPPRLETELRELGNLRNWIVHGVGYRSVILVEKREDGTMLEIDREDSVDWKTKFPATGFQSPDRIDHRDAYTAVHIALECVKFLARQETAIKFWINPLWNGPGSKTIGADLDVDAYLSGGLTEGSNGP